MPDASSRGAHCFSWDWREQPPMGELAEAVAEVSGGHVHLVPVDTGLDQHAWVVADRALTAEQARDVYSRGSYDPRPQQPGATP